MSTRNLGGDLVAAIVCNIRATIEHIEVRGEYYTLDELRTITTELSLAVKRAEIEVIRRLPQRRGAA